MGDMTERPEGQDSLASIIQTFEVEGYPLSVAEGRWLINEVKELREEVKRLREWDDDGGRVGTESVASLREGMQECPAKRDSLTVAEGLLFFTGEGALSALQKDALRTLINEVKELREENARLGHATSQTQMFKREQELNTRIKQVEEALRESERNLSEIVRGYEFRSTDEMLRWVRTQLSPSERPNPPPQPDIWPKCRCPMHEGRTHSASWMGN